MLAVVLAGGYTREGSGILRTMSTLRQLLTLDLVERLQKADVRLVLLSDDPFLLGEGQRMGMAVKATQKPFLWLQEVQQAVREELRAPGEAVLVLGGSAAPFLTVREIGWMKELAAGWKDTPGASGAVWQNNPLSPDLLLVVPGAAVLQVSECQSDNDLGYALERQAGLAVKMLPRELPFAFDVDTPLDVLLAGLACGADGAGAQAGVRLCEAVRSMRHLVPVERALEVLRRTDYPDVAVIGRAHPVEAESFARRVNVRLRLYSEERGMKALGRVQNGQVTSLIGTLLETLGPRAFFDRLAEQVQGVLFDTRVVLAERAARVGIDFAERDRFAADLLLAEEVSDPWLRELTLAAREAKIPVLTGGHSLVSGGLRVLAQLVEKRAE